MFAYNSRWQQKVTGTKNELTASEQALLRQETIVELSRKYLADLEDIVREAAARKILL